MSLRDMSVFAVEPRVNLNIFALCICYTVASSSVETASRRFVFAGNFCYYLLRIQARRLNNILIILEWTTSLDSSSGSLFVREDVQMSTSRRT